jgi:thiamine biosynthesis lipoprotein
MRWLGRGVGLGLLAVSVAGAAPLQVFTFTHPAMGTEYTLVLYARDAAEAEAVSSEVFDEVDRVDALLSNYKEASELSRINRDAAAGPVTTDAETMDFLEQSMHWSAVSDGAFDITVGKLMKSWGFYKHQGRVPPDAELDALRAQTGWEKVALDPAARTVRFLAPGVELDPGGIGKGFAVDAAVRILRADGVRAAMLSAGSSTIYALGAPPGKSGWRVVVPDLVASQDLIAGSPLMRQVHAHEWGTRSSALSVVTLRDTSLSSADCTQKNFTVAGHLYCHIMDPRTMRPVEGRVQVSVIDPSATASDALSNVVFVGIPEESVARLAKSAPEARALIVSFSPSGSGAERDAVPQGLKPISGVTVPVRAKARTLRGSSASSKRVTCVAIRWGVRVDASRCDVTMVRARP